MFLYGSNRRTNRCNSCCIIIYVFLLLLNALLSLSGNSGRLTWVRLQQPHEQRYPVLHVHAGSFRNPPNSDMDYILMRAYTHVWRAPRQRVSTFLTRKNSHNFLSCAPSDTGTGFEPPVFGSRVRRSTNLATPVTPMLRSFLRQVVWKWFSFLAWRWYTVHVLHA